MAREPPIDTESPVLQQIMRSLQEGVAVFDANLKCQIWNSYLEWLTGRKSADIIGKVFSETADFFRAENVQERFKRALQGESREPIEITYQNGTTGQTGWLLLTITPLINLQGETVGVIETVREISERKRSESLLKINQAHLEQAQSIARLGSWWLDPVTGTGGWSKEMFYLLHCNESAGTPTLDDFMKLIHPDDRESLLACHNNLLQTHTSFETEFRTNPDNGELRFILSKARVFSDADGNLYFEGTAQDISAIKRVSDEIVSLSRFPKENPNPVFQLDRAGRIILSNDASLPLLLHWYGEEENVLTGLIVDHANEAWRRKISINEDYNLGGKTYTLTFSPASDSDAVNVYGVDITDLKNIENSLRRSEASLRAAQQLAGFGHWELDIKTGESWWSDEMYRIHQLDPSTGKVTIEKLISFLHPDDVDTFRKNYYRCLSGTSTVRQEFRVILADKTERWIYSTIELLMDSEKNPSRLFGVSHDITERKIAEEHLRKNEAQLVVASQIAQLGYWEYDVIDGYFTFNDQFYSAFKTTVEKIGSYKVTPEQYANAFLLPEDRYVIAEETKNAMQAADENYSRQLEHRVVFGDGEIGYIAVRFLIVKDKQGRTIKTYGVNQDITERKLAEIRLQESQQKLNEAEKLAGIGDFSWDIVSGEVSWSDGMYELLGYNKDEKVDIETVNSRIHHPDDLPRISKWLEDCMLSGEPKLMSNQYRVIRKDGKVLTVRSEGLTRYDAGKPVAIFGMIQDISARLEAEKALRENEKKLATLMSNLTGMVYRCKEDEFWTMLFVNKACTDITGYTPEQIIGNRDISFAKIIHPADRDRIAHSVNEMLKNQSHFEFEYRIITKDGTEKWVWERGMRMDAYEGILEGVIHDITSRKIAEKALKENERKYRMLLNNLDDAVFLYPLLEDGFGIFEEVNKAARRRYGYNIDEFNRLSLKGITAQESMDKLVETGANRDLIKRRKYTYDAVHVNKHGSRFPVDVNTNLITIKNKVYVLSLVRDISERKKAEKEQQLLQIQLIQAQKMESIGRLAGGIAHDFNNMLGVILGNTEFALQQTAPGQLLHADLMEIQKAALRSAELTGQLLAFARKQTVTPKILDLNVVLSGMLKMLRRIMGEDIDLVWIPAEELWTVRMDPGQISQVLVNLCVNARDAIIDNGQVIIETMNNTLDEAFCEGRVGVTPGDYTALIVSDNGHGMEKAVVERVFEPFFTTKKVGEGTGLGLATVYGIVKQNNGFIYVYSEPGRGATFKIYFPRYTGKLEKEVISTNKSEDSIKEKTVLLVEDERSILLLSKRMLESMGYKVISAMTPAEAIKLAEENIDQIDLLMTDIVMPEMDGQELANRLEELYPGLKKLFVSGYTANVIAQRGVLDEGIHFLQKPFSIQELGKKVEEALGE